MKTFYEVTASGAKIISGDDSGKRWCCTLDGVQYEAVIPDHPGTRIAEDRRRWCHAKRILNMQLKDSTVDPPKDYREFKEMLQFIIDDQFVGGYDAEDMLLEEFVNNSVGVL